LRYGAVLIVGDVKIHLERKSGQIARLRVDADRATPVVVIGPEGLVEGLHVVRVASSTRIPLEDCPISDIST